MSDLSQQGPEVLSQIGTPLSHRRRAGAADFDANISAAPVSRFGVVWRPIPKSDYEASCLGMVRNARTKRILTPASDRDGYLIVNIRQGGRSRVLYVHRLILLAFKGEPPTPQHQAAHADGCRQHNAIWNLRWATAVENAADRTRHRAIRRLTASNRRRLTQRIPMRIVAPRWRIAR